MPSTRAPVANYFRRNKRANTLASDTDLSSSLSSSAGRNSPKSIYSPTTAPSSSSVVPTTQTPSSPRQSLFVFSLPLALKSGSIKKKHRRLIGSPDQVFPTTTLSSTRSIDASTDPQPPPLLPQSPPTMEDPSELASLKSQLADRPSLLSKLDQQASQISLQHTQLEQQSTLISQLQLQTPILESTISQLKSHIAKLESDRIPKLEMEIDDLQFEVETLQEQMAAQRADSKDEIQVLRFQLEHARIEARRLQAELEEAGGGGDGGERKMSASYIDDTCSLLDSIVDPNAPPAPNITRSLEWGTRFGRMALEKELEEMREQAVGARAEREILEEDVREAREEIEGLVKKCAELEFRLAADKLPLDASSTSTSRPPPIDPTSPRSPLDSTTLRSLEHDRQVHTSRVRVFEMDRAALIKDRETLFKDRATLLQDREALIKETGGLYTERTTLNTERIALHTERSTLNSERQGLSEERQALWKERQRLDEDRQGLDQERRTFRESREEFERERESFDREREVFERERAFAQVSSFNNGPVKLSSDAFASFRGRFEDSLIMEGRGDSVLLDSVAGMGDLSVLDSTTGTPGAGTSTTITEERAELRSARESLLNDRVMLNARMDSLDVERKFFEKSKVKLDLDQKKLEGDQKKLEGERKFLDGERARLDGERRALDLERKRLDTERKRLEGKALEASRPSLEDVESSEREKEDPKSSTSTLQPPKPQQVLDSQHSSVVRRRSNLTTGIATPDRTDSMSSAATADDHHTPKPVPQSDTSPTKAKEVSLPSVPEPIDKTIADEFDGSDVDLDEYLANPHKTMRQPANHQSPPLNPKPLSFWFTLYRTRRVHKYATLFAGKTWLQVTQMTADHLRDLVDDKGEHVAEAPFNTLVSCIGIIGKVLGGDLAFTHPQANQIVDVEVLSMENRPAALEALVQHLPVLPAKRTGRKEATNKKKRRQARKATDAEEFPPLNPSPTTATIKTPPVSKVPQSPVSKAPQSPVSKAPQSPVLKAPQSPVLKAPQSPVLKAPQSPVSKAPQSPISRPPQSPVSSPSYPISPSSPIRHATSGSSIRQRTSSPVRSRTPVRPSASVPVRPTASSPVRSDHSPPLRHGGAPSPVRSTAPTSIASVVSSPTRAGTHPSPNFTSLSSQFNPDPPDRHSHPSSPLESGRFKTDIFRSMEPLTSRPHPLIAPLGYPSSQPLALSRPPGPLHSSPPRSNTSPPFPLQHSSPPRSSTSPPPRASISFGQPLPRSPLTSSIHRMSVDLPHSSTRNSWAQPSPSDNKSNDITSPTPPSSSRQMAPWPLSSSAQLPPRPSPVSSSPITSSSPRNRSNSQTQGTQSFVWMRK